tara:strand:- start:99 stop:662 length:564 start_codon:yes stop_codon:yes gene_type:complete
LTASPHRATLQENEGGALRQSELKAILKDHKLWIQSNGKQGKRAYLVGADLHGADLWGVNLGGANLEYANLDNANLQGADLQGANLVGAYLVGADLVGADLVGAYLVGAYLQGADLWRATLQHANLKHANLKHANLQHAKFTTNFKKVRWFDGATFSEDQIPWVVLHPMYPDWADTIKWVKAEQLSA